MFVYLKFSHKKIVGFSVQNTYLSSKVVFFKTISLSKKSTDRTFTIAAINKAYTVINLHICLQKLQLTARDKCTVILMS